jgi:methyl-accepting chemotaxis protein
MLSNLKIGTRLAMGFAIVLLGSLAIWVVSALNIEHATELAKNASDRHERTSALARAQNALWALRWDVAQFVAVNDAAGRKQIVDRAAPTRQRFEEAMGVYAKAKAGSLTSEEEALRKELLAAFIRYSDARLRWFELMGAGNLEDATRFRAETLTPAGAATVATLSRLNEEQDKLMGLAEAAFLEDQKNEAVALYTLGFAVLVIASLIAWLLSRSITTPLKEAVVSVETVARGDLTRPIQVRTRDELGQLLHALATMQGNLKELVGDVVGSAQAVSDSSAQIAQGNIDLSQRTEEQASTLEETAGSMEELTATVNQNADHARQANELAAGASEVATKGGQVVGEVVRTMTGISESSRKISDIIGVIDGIAFQTNILALNAAVEAARAGDQGRGFAVVAAEVRNLAQRSAGAAKEIKTLIGDSVDQVEAGTRLVDAAGVTMQEIVGSVKKVSNLIAEIASASQEQSQGIAQVTSAVTQMEQVVQQNATLVEEATAATESMKAQAGALLQSVGRFNIGAVHAEPRARGEPVHASVATPGPIRFVPAATGKPAPARALPPAARLGAAAHTGNGEWKEF